MFFLQKRNYLWTEGDSETHYERELCIPLSPQAKCRYRFKNKINTRTFKHYMLKNLLEQYSDQYQGYTHFLLTELFYNVYVCTLEFNLFYFIWKYNCSFLMYISTLFINNSYVIVLEKYAFTTWSRIMCVGPVELQIMSG